MNILIMVSEQIIVVIIILKLSSFAVIMGHLWELWVWKLNETNSENIKVFFFFFFFEKQFSRYGNTKKKNYG